MFVNSKPMIGLPLKKVFFPSDSEESVENSPYLDPFTGTDIAEANKYIDNKLQFRIDADNIPCANSSIHFCENVGQQLYPSQYVESMLQNHSDRYAEFFNKVEFRDDFSHTNRVEHPLCPAHKRDVYPEIAMDVDSEWFFIVNTPQTRQHIRIELCKKRSCQCESLPNGTESTCMQKFGITLLAALDHNGGIVKKEFKFPSYCECVRYRKKPTKNRVRTKN